MMTMLLFLAAATAQADPKPMPAADAPVAAPRERKICRQETRTETRMGAKRICRTAKEWQAVDAGNGFFSLGRDLERTGGG